MTTEVVPSPTSLSCISESCTRTRAAGCSTSSCARIVAPSLVIVTSRVVDKHLVEPDRAARLDDVGDGERGGHILRAHLGARDALALGGGEGEGGGSAKEKVSTHF